MHCHYNNSSQKTLNSLTYKLYCGKINISLKSYERGGQKVYHCLITFVLFTHNPKYTEILRKINLPEDCSISFKDQSDSSNADCLKDTALIFDDIATYKENAALFTGDFRKVIMVSPEKAIEAIQLSNSVSDIWLLPSNEYDALLKFQAEKLVKAMKEAFDFRLQTISMTTAFDSILEPYQVRDTVKSCCHADSLKTKVKSFLHCFYELFCLKF